MYTKQTSFDASLLADLAVKATKEGARRRNLELALQSVYRQGVTTRAEISRLTGLTRATVSDLILELVVSGLVREMGPGPSSGGKPPTLISVDPGGRAIVALDLSRQPFEGALVDLGGTLGERRRSARRAPRGRRAVEAVLTLTRELVESAEAPVLGVGIGTPGVVDLDGVVVEAANLGWHGVALRDEVAEATGLPTQVANDAHAAAAAEYGSRHATNLAVVKVGVGIGAGIVVDGRLFRGDRPGAGEIGHVRVVEDGAECTCGNRGCLETVASVPSILRDAARRAGRPDADVSALPWDLHELEAELGPQPTREAVAAAGRHLGTVLASLVAILDVHQIAIEVELAGAEGIVFEAVRAEVAERILPSIASVVEFSETSHGSDLVLAGAAAMVLGEELGVVWR
jgi:predicted NBD/HSP70 family sugar kinase